jgi:tetratricopeptide (TPR) repeat protein
MIPFAPSLSRKLHEQSGGNPFFLTQLANILETQTAVPGSALSDLPIGLPAEVKHAVLVQVRTLPDSAIDLLTIAAAVGSEIDCSILDRAASREPGWALESLAPALSLRLLLTIPDQPNHIKFAHALVREAIYGATEIGCRTRTHKAIAAAIEATHPLRSDAYAGELAYHYRQAHDFQRACAYYARAGDAARERLAFEDAAICYRAALASNDSLESLSLSSRVEILLGLGDVEMRAGERARGRDALEEAAMLSRRIRRPDLLAKAALSLAPAFFLLEVGVVDHALIGILEEALTRLEPEHALLRAQLLARLGVALAYSDESERSRRLSADAVEIAERSGDTSTVAYVLTARHPLLFGPERASERLQSASRVIQAALATGDRETALVHRLFRLTELLASGAMQLVEAEIAAFSQLAQEIDLPQSRWYAVLFRAMRHHMRGELAEAEERANEFLARGQEVGDRNAMLSFTAMTTLVRVERGAFSELAPMVDSVRNQFPAIDLAWRCAAAWAFSENGDTRRAQEHVERVDIDEMPRDVLWLCSLTSLAIGVAWLGDESRAHRLYETLRPYAQLNAVVGYGVACLGSVSRALGMLCAAFGDWTAANDWFVQALAANRRLDSPIWIAHTLHAHARMLGSHGSRSAVTKATGMATEAISIASALGMTSLEARARRLARDLDRRVAIRFSYLT